MSNPKTPWRKDAISNKSTSKVEISDVQQRQNEARRKIENRRLERSIHDDPLFEAPGGDVDD